MSQRCARFTEPLSHIRNFLSQIRKTALIHQPASHRGYYFLSHLVKYYVPPQPDSGTMLAARRRS